MIEIETGLRWLLDGQLFTHLESIHHEFDEEFDDALHPKLHAELYMQLNRELRTGLTEVLRIELKR
jgi:hypothetical protein